MIHRQVKNQRKHFYLYFSLRGNGVIKLLDLEHLTRVLWKIMCREFPPCPLLVPYVIHAESPEAAVKSGLQGVSGVAGLRPWALRKGHSIEVQTEMSGVSIQNPTSLGLT